ncbi:MAG: hypothetical protein QXH27_01010 [Candidatus Micrarchaeia archaeon]
MAEELDITKKEVSPVEAFKFQNMLFQQFGEDGVKVYGALGEHRNVGDLMNLTGVSESRLLEILDFMDKNGMIAMTKAAAPAAPPEKVLTEEEIEEKKRMEKAGRERVLEIREEKPPEEEMSPFEKVVFDKFGKIGLRVYSLIDGEKTAEEILAETGISEVQLVEMLEFMDKQGIIKLEKPEEEKEEEEKEEGEEEEKPEEEFPAPLIEEKGLPPAAPAAAPPEEISEEAIPIDVPIKQALGAVNRIALDAELVARFGGRAKRLYDAIDNRKDTVRLARETGMSLEEMDEALAFLGQRGALVFATLSSDDVRERYGLEGERIYNKYGRDGVLLYELIGVVKSFRDMVALSRLQPDKAADIFLYIHDVLAIETPLTKEMLFKELGK